MSGFCYIYYNFTIMKNESCVIISQNKGKGDKSCKKSASIKTGNT